MVNIPRTATIVLFDGFELLDVFGPVELFSLVPGLSITYAGPSVGPVKSSQGARVIAELTHDELHEPDIILVPGGVGTRPLVQDTSFLHWLGNIAAASRVVTSVCTGSALLAAAGVLDGYRATSNKAAFDWARGCSQKVDWVPRARWVHDRNRWTSSGVAAGMDMTYALIEHLFDSVTAQTAARRAEYEPHRDADEDPFATLHDIT